MGIKKKLVLTVMMVLCIVSMFFSWFGGARGVQEISGLWVLKNPFTIPALVLIGVGVWLSKPTIGLSISVSGTLLLLVVEIYSFCTWHMETVSGKFDLMYIFRNAFPEFYIGLFLALTLFVGNLLFRKRT